MERIERENIKIAQKIFELKPYLQMSELEDRFHQQRRYAQSIRRIVKKKVVPPGRLPPLEQMLQPVVIERDAISKSVIVTSSTGAPGKGLVQAVMQVEDQKGNAGEPHTHGKKEADVVVSEEAKKKESGEQVTE